MHVGIVAATFALVIPAELPDKTFISAIVLSSRYRPGPVWVGVSAGLILQAALAVLAGRLLALLPHRVVEGVVAGLFIAGAAYLLFVPEKVEERAGEEIAEREEEFVEGDGPPPAALGPTWARIALTTFGIIALAEFGDLTQVLIANLAARTRDPLSVFVGSTAAFLAIAAAGVFAGRTLTRVVPLGLIRKLSGVALAALGIWSAVNTALG